MTNDIHMTTHPSSESLADNIFPPMTDFEKNCMIEWGENNELNVMSLVNVFSKHINNADGHTYTQKIKNLDFTIINNNFYYNPFVQILTIFYMKQTIEKDDPDYDKNQTHFNNLIMKFWGELLDYLNITPD